MLSVAQLWGLHFCDKVDNRKLLKKVEAFEEKLQTMEESEAEKVRWILLGLNPIALR